MIRVLRCGDWSVSQVSVAWVANTRQLLPEVELAIDAAWTTALARPGIQLFDGPMCRLESWEATGGSLRLNISPSSYKSFLGTNMAHPEFADRFGRTVMANPVGVSPALLTADGQLLLGRRTASVAYYPNRIHPFAGCMEPTDANPFSAIVRELHEELSLEAHEVTDIHCTGIAEDKNLRQSELIFSAATQRTRAEIESRLDRVEHESIWSVTATDDAVAAAVGGEAQLTPVAMAALMLWGRTRFGQKWYSSLAPQGDR